jgi:hypothetical protein
MSDDLGIARVPVWEHVTMWLGLECRNFKWARDMLTNVLRRKRIDGAKALLKVLESQVRIALRDLITGDRSWTFLNTSQSSIWIGGRNGPNSTACT